MNVHVKHIGEWHCIDARGRCGDNVNMAPVKKPKPHLQRTFLREWREAKNMTQETAAHSLGVSRALLSKIENGKSPYKQGFLEASAELYGCSTAELLMRDPSDQNAVWSLQDHLKKAPADVRQRILSVVETLLKTG